MSASTYTHVDTHTHTQTHSNSQFSLAGKISFSSLFDFCGTEKKIKSQKYFPACECLLFFYFYFLFCFLCLFRFTKSSNCEILFVVSVLRFFSFVSAMFNVQLCAESALLCSARSARRQRKLNYVCFVAAAAAAAATAVAAGVAAETRRQSVSNAGCSQRRR